MIKVRVVVTLKKAVLDPQGQAIASALSGLGFHNILELTQGKVFDLKLDETDCEIALKQATEMCESLLTNMVIETYEITIVK